MTEAKQNNPSLRGFTLCAIAGAALVPHRVMAEPYSRGHVVPLADRVAYDKPFTSLDKNADPALKALGAAHSVTLKWMPDTKNIATAELTLPPYHCYAIVAKLHQGEGLSLAPKFGDDFFGCGTEHGGGELSSVSSCRISSNGKMVLTVYSNDHKPVANAYSIRIFQGSMSDEDIATIKHENQLCTSAADLDVPDCMAACVDQVCKSSCEQTHAKQIEICNGTGWGKAK